MQNHKCRSRVIRSMCLSLWTPDPQRQEELHRQDTCTQVLRRPQLQPWGVPRPRVTGSLECLCQGLQWGLHLMATVLKVSTVQWVALPRATHRLNDQPSRHVRDELSRRLHLDLCLLLLQIGLLTTRIVASRSLLCLNSSRSRHQHLKVSHCGSIQAPLLQTE